MPKEIFINITYMEVYVMGAIIVSGGQYGSEGKGKIASYLAKKFDAVAAVRVGGPKFWSYSL